VDTRTSTKVDWAVRKPRYVARLARAQQASLEVAVADKVQNAQSLLDDYRHHGEKVWARFERPSAEYLLWYYGRLAEVFATRLADHPLTPRLSDTVNELTDRVRETVPDIETKVHEVRTRLS
jgi:hypothetical protein